MVRQLVTPDQTGNYNNFINGKGTDQNNDPMTTKDDEYTGDESLKIAMYTNSLGIAIDNRYGGIAAGKMVVKHCQHNQRRLYCKLH